ncbi:unnamed protein product [Paramecium pentaurelia]|uniref:Uncharacterized protein n=1 Tax=Paramecium pentaurelia TaxID=43138 RepID=A0A8S1YFU7_9CILI|nr:unnamed protein product [Paramecium pentaurelia]
MILPPLIIEARSVSLKKQEINLKQENIFTNVFSSNRCQHILNLQRKKKMLQNQLQIVNKSHFTNDQLSEIYYFRSKLNKQFKLD